MSAFACPRRASARRDDVLASAAGVVLIALLGFGASAAPIVVTPSADAEIRETAPEFTRGSPLPPASGSSTQKDELQISSLPNTGGVINSASSNRNLAVIRFHLPNEIQSSAALMNYAELRLTFRPNAMNGAGSLRLYGLKPTSLLNATWDETNVMYRDAGIHQNPNPVIGSGQANLTPSVIAQPAFPAPPILGTPGYGADPNHPRRAPGIRYENAPYSTQVDAENQARFTWNQSHPSQILPYVNQPGYNVGRIGEGGGTLGVPNAISVGDGDPTTTGDGFTDIYNDVPNSNRPFYSGATQTWVDDLIASDTTYIGYSQVTFPSNTNYGGQYISVGANAPTFAGTSLNNDTPVADAEAARAALVSFLGTYIDQGQRDFTFIVGPGIGTLAGGGPERINNANLQIASKEYTPANGTMGDYAAQLILTPEPGAVSLLMIAAGTLLGARRRP
jgi:hypothetical protein